MIYSTVLIFEYLSTCAVRSFVEIILKTAQSGMQSIWMQFMPTTKVHTLLAMR